MKTRNSFLPLALAAVLGASLGVQAQEDAPPSNEGARADLYGEPLPPGAVARLGSLNPSESDERTGHEAGVYAVVVLPGGKRVATRGGDSTVRVWDLGTGRQEFICEGHLPLGRSLEASPDGKYLAAANRDEAAPVWEADTGKLLRSIPAAGSLLTFKPDSRTLAVLDRDKLITYDVRDGEQLKVYSAPSYVLAVSPDAANVAALPRYNDYRIRLIELATSKQLAELTGCESKPTACAISHDGRTVAAGGQDQTIRLWEMNTSRPMFVLEGHESTIHTLAFSADGRFLASGSGDKTVRIWEVSTGKQVHRFDGHEGHVAAVAFSPDSRYLVSGSTDKTGLVWDLSPRTLVVGDPRPLDDEVLAELWDDLSEEDTPRAYQAIRDLVAEPKVALEFLEAKLESIVGEDQDDRVARLIRELDHDRFAVRERASAELLRLRDIAKPALEKAYRDTTSAEVRYRIRQILRAPEPAHKVSPHEERRMLRVLQALEHLGTPAARALVQRIAGAFPSEQVNRDARATLARMQPEEAG